MKHNKINKKKGGDDNEVNKNGNKIVGGTINEFKILNYKFLLYTKIYKYYNHIILDEILDSLNKSIKFLNKYELLILSTINNYKTDIDGNLDKYSVRMLLTIIKRFLFDNIFKNYFLQVISKYYHVISSEEIKSLIDILNFVKDLQNPQYNNMKNDIINDLENSRFNKNYNIMHKEFEDNVEKENNDDDNESEEDELTDDDHIERLKKINDRISKNYLKKFQSLEDNYINIQSTVLWWSKIKKTLLRELNNNNNNNDEYIKSLIIFIKQMLTESIYNDLFSIDHLEVRKQNVKSENNGNLLYVIYKDMLLENFINKFDKIIEEKTNPDNTDNDINNIHEKFMKQIDTKYDNLIIEKPTSILILTKIKYELTKKFKTYVDIIKTITIAKKNQNTNSKYIDMDSKISKEYFINVVNIIIIYLKQNLLNYFKIYKSSIDDLKIFQDKLFIITEKLYEAK
tara:strand:+ start:4396 stop:5763 length:1368 start_codon:yes stop_codon:yes gene_type:complete